MGILDFLKKKKEEEEELPELGGGLKPTGAYGPAGPMTEGATAPMPAPGTMAAPPLTPPGLPTQPTIEKLARQIETLNYKLDSIKAALDTINSRLAAVEAALKSTRGLTY